MVTAFPSYFTTSPRPTATVTAGAPTRQDVGQVYLALFQGCLQIAGIPSCLGFPALAWRQIIHCNRWLKKRCNAGQAPSFRRRYMEPRRCSSSSFCWPAAVAGGEASGRCRCCQRGQPVVSVGVQSVLGLPQQILFMGGAGNGITVAQWKANHSLPVRVSSPHK